MRVSITMDARRLQAGLQRAARGGSRMRPAFERIADVLLESIRQNFAVGGRPRWPRRRPSRGRQRDGKLLVDTGRLLRSLAGRAGATFAEVAAKVPYAAFHQYGSGPIPARPFLDIQPGDEPPIAEAIEQHLLGGLR